MKIFLCIVLAVLINIEIFAVPSIQPKDEVYFGIFASPSIVLYQERDGYIYVKEQTPEGEVVRPFCVTVWKQNGELLYNFVSESYLERLQNNEWLICEAGSEKPFLIKGIIKISPAWHIN